MDGRITHGPSPFARIAAVCRSLILRFSKPVPDRPDYADLNEWLQIYLQREFLLERLDESTMPQTPERNEQLRTELVKAETKIAENKL